MRQRVFALVAFFATTAVWGHARLINPVPRSNNPGIKTGPCGGVARGASGQAVPTFAPGATIQVQWEETIDHPGRFLFFLSTSNDENFVSLINPNDPNVGIEDNQNNANTPHSYQANITLPAGVTCEECTLQMIQQMRNDNIPDYYFSCADIRIAADAPAQPAPPVVPPPQNGQGAQAGIGVDPDFGKPGFGCGLVGVRKGPPPGSTAMAALLLMLPLIVLSRLKLAARKVRRERL